MSTTFDGWIDVEVKKLFRTPKIKRRFAVLNAQELRILDAPRGRTKLSLETQSIESLSVGIQPHGKMESGTYFVVCQHSQRSPHRLYVASHEMHSWLSAFKSHPVLGKVLVTPPPDFDRKPEKEDDIIDDVKHVEKHIVWCETTSSSTITTEQAQTQSSSSSKEKDVSVMENEQQEQQSNEESKKANETVVDQKHAQATDVATVKPTYSTTSINVTTVKPTYSTASINGAYKMTQASEKQTQPHYRRVDISTVQETTTKTSTTTNSESSMMVSEKKTHIYIFSKMFQI
jgi:hypothetical protein